MEPTEAGQATSCASPAGAAELAGTTALPERISALSIALEGRRRFTDRLLIATLHPTGIRASAVSRRGRQG